MSERIHRPVIALGYQAQDGTITVTDVLCMNFPDMTNNEMVKLSWMLTELGRQHTRDRIEHENLAVTDQETKAVVTSLLKRRPPPDLYMPIEL